MGCASSSPLVTANGKVLEAAKGAASDAMHAGEDAFNGVKSTVTETVENVKEAVVEAVQNVGHGIESAINGNKNNEIHKNDDIKDIGVMDSNNHETIKSKQIDDPDSKYIPLKDPTAATKSAEMETALDQLTETINSKSKEYQDEAEKLTDDLIKETDDIVTDTIETTNQQVTKSINQALAHSSPVHSLNSLETNSPEPEIEKAMANESKMNPPTPKPTYSELEKLQSGISSSIVNTMNMIDLTTSSIIENSTTTTTTTTNGSNGQVLVSAEINSEDLSNEDETELDHTINESDCKTSENENDFDFNNERKLSVIEETDWEKLADQIVKLPINKLQAYREVTLTSSARATSVDNIFKHCNTFSLN